MCHPSILWTSILVYGPFFQSMSLHLILWTLVSAYVPSPCSMDRHPHSMDRFHFPILHQQHFRSMCHPSILWTSILFYVPLSASMCHYLVLWTNLHVLCAFALFYGPTSTFYVPTTNTTNTASTSATKNRMTITLLIVIRSSQPEPHSSALLQRSQYLPCCIFALFYAVGDADAFK